MLSVGTSLKVCHLVPCPDGSVLSGELAPPGWLSGECVGLMTWWLWQLFFPAYFRLSPLQKYVREVVGGFGKKSCVSTGVRKPGNTYASLTAMILPLLLNMR